MNWKSINGINKPFETKAEALEAELEYKKKDNRTIASVTLYMLYDEWIETTKSTFKESTYNNYIKFRKNYLSLAKDIPIISLSSQFLLRWKNKLLALNLSVAFTNRTIKIMILTLQYGSMMYGLSPTLQVPLLEKVKDYNVVAHEDAPKTKYLPPDKFELLYNAIDLRSRLHTEYYKCVINVLYKTGLRIGELAALTTKDIKDNYIIVNKDYIRIDSKDIIQTPKSKNSIRKVYIDSELQDQIKKWLDHKPNHLGNIVIFNLRSNYLNQQILRRVLSKAQEKANLKDYDITPHTLRHSHASNLRALGYDEFEISDRLGNTPSVASSTYIHITDEERLKIGQNLKK